MSHYSFRILEIDNTPMGYWSTRQNIQGQNLSEVCMECCWWFQLSDQSASLFPSRPTIDRRIDEGRSWKQPHTSCLTSPSQTFTNGNNLQSKTFQPSEPSRVNIAVEYSIKSKITAKELTTDTLIGKQNRSSFTHMATYFLFLTQNM